ncbi:MAG: ComF family protein [Candidatus Marinimicrobia bacterium]|nr:ComF family protein [Candidatus Neomarinimicrobiota bacterium]
MQSPLKSLEQFIYPQYCNDCDKPLSESEQLFCSKCRETDIQFSRLGNWVRQLKTHNNLDYAHSFYWFGKVIQAYIHHLKYSGWDSFLPRLINNAIRESELPKEASGAVLIPIPLHRVRQRDRGFNQAMVIAKELARQWNLKLDDKILKREKYTQTQTTLSISERQKNMYMAFQVNKSAPKAVLLIDDVLTTGSTADACAMQLRERGSTWVGVVTLATPKIKKIYR